MGFEPMAAKELNAGYAPAILLSFNLRPDKERVTFRYHSS